MEKVSLLAIDVGAGTNDILVWSEDFLPANCPRLLVPSSSVLVGNEILKLAEKGKNIHLTGFLMGGGASTRAVKSAIGKGVKVTATPESALTLHDNLDRVREMGVEIREEPLEGYEVVEMRDVDLNAIAKSLAPWGIEVPDNIAVAVQDHGHSPNESNRSFRFKHWKSIMDKGGRIADLHPSEPPPYMTRMLSVKKQVPLALVIDTGPAAILGALEDEEIAKAVADNGAVVVNFGNAHTIAFLIRGEKLFGLFEHHTRSLDERKVRTLVERLRSGEITNEEVYNERGHGAIYCAGFEPGGFDSVFATGPRRKIARGLARFAAPHGDMMMTGCFGLIRAWKQTRFGIV